MEAINSTASICSRCGRTVRRIVLVDRRTALCEACATPSLLAPEETEEARKARQAEENERFVRQLHLQRNARAKLAQIDGPLFSQQGGLF